MTHELKIYQFKSTKENRGRALYSRCTEAQAIEYSMLQSELGVFAWSYEATRFTINEENLFNMTSSLEDLRDALYYDNEEYEE